MELCQLLWKNCSVLSGDWNGLFLYGIIDGKDHWGVSWSSRALACYHQRSKGHKQAERSKYGFEYLPPETSFRFPFIYLFLILKIKEDLDRVLSLVTKLRLADKVQKNGRNKNWLKGRDSPAEELGKLLRRDIPNLFTFTEKKLIWL